MPDDSHETDTDQGTGSAPDDLDERIERVLRSVLPEILAGRDDSGAGSDDAGGSPGGAPVRSLRQQEFDAETEVRRALAKIRAEDDAESRLTKIEKALEHVPQKMGKLKRIIWGDDEQAKGA